jgi:glycosyltransferase involved in cell wall biosynthesis
VADALSELTSQAPDDRDWLASRVLPDLPTIASERHLPLVSIIITAYNYEKYIDECIAAVAAQTYAKFECIVVDDCSTDDSENVAKRSLAVRRDQRFSYVRNPENLGQLGTQAVGLSQCKGAFVVFVDADDLLLPTFVERHVFFHINSPLPVALSSGDQAICDESGCIVAATRRDFTRVGNYGSARLLKVSTRRSNQPMEALILSWAERRLDTDWVWGQQSAMMFRRSALELIMPKPEECDGFRICADLYLGRYAHLVGNSALLLERLGIYRLHGNNNFAAYGMVSFDSAGGDMSKRPSLRELAVLALSIMKQRDRSFTLTLGTWRHQTTRSILEAWSKP